MNNKDNGVVWCYARDVLGREGRSQGGGLSERYAETVIIGFPESLFPEMKTGGSALLPEPVSKGDDVARIYVPQNMAPR